MGASFWAKWIGHLNVIIANKIFESVLHAKQSKCGAILTIMEITNNAVGALCMFLDAFPKAMVLYNEFDNIFD